MKNLVIYVKCARYFLTACEDLGHFISSIDITLTRSAINIFPKQGTPFSKTYTCPFSALNLFLELCRERLLNFDHDAHRLIYENIIRIYCNSFSPKIY